MKKLCLSFLVVFLLGGTNSFTQTNPGDIELSASATLGSYSQTAEYNGQSIGGESTTYFTLAARPGFFIITSLEIEPELMLTLVEDEEPSISMSGNLSYNFNIPESNIHPFIMAGYGIGNSLPILSILFNRSSDEFDIKHLNLGAGIKVLFNEHVAARIEYRFQEFYYESGDDDFYSYEYTITTHKVMFGISVFL